MLLRRRVWGQICYLKTPPSPSLALPLSSLFFSPPPDKADRHSTLSQVCLLTDIAYTLICLFCMPYGLLSTGSPLGVALGFRPNMPQWVGSLCAAWNENPPFRKPPIRFSRNVALNCAKYPLIRDILGNLRAIFFAWDMLARNRRAFCFRRWNSTQELYNHSSPNATKQKPLRIFPGYFEPHKVFLVLRFFWITSRNTLQKKSKMAIFRVIFRFQGYFNLWRLSPKNNLKRFLGNCCKTTFAAQLPHNFPRRGQFWKMEKIGEGKRPPPPRFQPY